MTPLQIGSLARAIRIRQGLRQVDLGRIAGVSRWAISLLERGELRMLSYGVIEKTLHTLGARLDARVLWNGPDVDSGVGGNER